MKFIITGKSILEGQNRGEKYYRLYMIDLEREWEGLEGHPIGRMNCTKLVYDFVEPSMTTIYELNTSFDGKIINHAELV